MVQAKHAVRAAVAAAFLLFAVFLGAPFVGYLSWLLSAEGLAATFRGRWDIVALNVAFFLAFLAFLPFKRKVSWRSHGVFAAFIVALFAEMYGMPFTIFLMSGALAPSSYSVHSAFTFEFLGAAFDVPDFALYGLLISLAGCAVVVLGWRRIYGGGGRSLATDGVYAVSRHPQYLGFLMIALGWLVGWPTPVTIAMFPILAATYYGLAKDEENDMEKAFGSRFKHYKEKTPIFV